MLSELSLTLYAHTLFGEGVSAEVCAALRGARLSFLDLSFTCLFSSAEGGEAVLEALTGHSSLQGLDLGFNTPTSPEAKLAFVEALGRLVSAESALEALFVQHCGLGDNALRPLFAAVAQSTSLRRLDCRWYSISPEFARSVVLPAIRSNTSLRELKITDGPDAELAPAEALVNARRD
jgi:hypothetical protein